MITGAIDVTLGEADMQRYIQLNGLDDSVRKRQALKSPRRSPF